MNMGNLLSKILHKTREGCLPGKKLIGNVLNDVIDVLKTYWGLSSGKLQVVCVGDGFHSESRAILRWKKALGEYTMDFIEHRAIDEEMSESLGVIIMVMKLKTAFPYFFHFLKGNHENIANENSADNRSFRKFVYEGAMVTT